MRLWHKNLVPYLPYKQICGQWRECCSIAKGLRETGKTNHVLINRIMDYPIGDFVRYAGYVCGCMDERGITCNPVIFLRYFDNDVRRCTEFGLGRRGDVEDIFEDWHNNKYLVQCYHNLEEKYDCKGISDSEWAVIRDNIFV